MGKGVHRGVGAGRNARAGGDRELLRVVDAAFAAAADRAGAWLTCESGCSRCCHGPFPINRLDVRRLRQGLEALRRADPARAAAVERRARAAAGRIGPVDLRDRDGLDERFASLADLACPALDPLSGRCELYAWRPVACRAYGPPLRFGDARSDPCSLCFVGASASEVERCRYEPDRDGIETVMLHDAGVRAGDEWESLVAFALVVG